MQKKFLAIAVVALIAPSFVRAEDSSVNYADKSVIPADKEVIKFSDAGIQPAHMILKGDDSSVFFVNTTKDALVTFTVDFGAKRSHCATDNMKFAEGKLQSVRPIAPKDFAVTCFPEKGTYPMEVHGLTKGADTVTRGEIVVE